MGFLGVFSVKPVDNSRRWAESLPLRQVGGEKWQKIDQSPVNVCLAEAHWRLLFSLLLGRLRLHFEPINFVQGVEYPVG